MLEVMETTGSLREEAIRKLITDATFICKSSGGKTVACILYKSKKLFPIYCHNTLTNK